MDTKRLRQRVLDLAIHGKLVPQNPQDEPASELLKRIAAEKERLIKEGKIKKSKKKDNEDIEKVPFEVPQGWVWTKLPYVTTKITDGTHHSPESYPKGDYLYVTAKNIKRWGIDLSEITYVDKDTHNEIYSRCNPEYGDILYIKDGATTGIVTINTIKLPFSLLSSVALIKPSKEICNKYLLYYLQSSICYDNVRESMKGVGITRITLRQIETWSIPLPPLAEQHRIVSEVEKYFSLIDILEENENDLQQSIQKAKSKILDLAIKGKLVEQNEEDESASVLLERIKEENNRNEKKSKIKDTKINEVPFEVPQGWVWTNIKILCSKIVDGDHNPPKGTKTATNYRMLSSKNIANNQIEDIDDCRYLTYEDWELCNSRTQLSKGDILLTTVATLGRSCVVEKEYPFCFQRSVTVISTYIHNYFLKYFFDSPYFQTYMSDNAKGTAQKGFYLNQFENSPIPLPPLAEQHRIVAKIEELFTQLYNIAEALK